MIGWGMAAYVQEQMQDVEREIEADRLARLVIAQQTRHALSRRLGEQLAVVSMRLLGAEITEQGACQRTELSNGQVMTLCDSAA